MQILLLLLISCGAGMALRNWRVLRYIDRSATYTVWLLIFIFGISLGANKEIVNDFARFGFTALVVSVAGVTGSVIAAWGLMRFVDKGRRK